MGHYDPRKRSTPWEEQKFLEKPARDMRTPPINVRLTAPAGLPTLPAADIGRVKPYPAGGGTGFQVQFSPPIVLKDNVNYVITVYSGNIPFTQPNFAPAGTSPPIPNRPAGNNRITITVNALAATQILVPLGLYGLADLQLAINKALFEAVPIAAGYNQDPVNFPLIQLIVENATQVITLHANFSAVNFPGVNTLTIDLTAGDSMQQDLGLPAGPTVLTAGGTELIEGTSAGDMFGISEYHVHTDLATGSYLDGGSDNIIMTIPLGSFTPNSYITWTPYFDQPVPLGKTIVNDARFWVTDQDGHLLTGFGNNAWSVNFAIREQ